MADTKISAMAAASTLAAADIVPVVQGGANVKATFTQVATEVLGIGLNAQSAGTTVAGTEKLAAYQGGGVYLTPAQLSAYVNTLAVGDVQMRVLWKLIGANMNSTADQAMTKIGTFSTFIAGPNGNVRVVNPSAAASSAVGGIYTGASKSGINVVSAGATWGGLTGTGTGAANSCTATGLAVLSASTMFVSLATPHGSAATADWYFLGIPLS